MPESKRNERRRSANNDTIDLAELASTLERHRWLAIGIAAVVAASSLLYSSTRTPVYKTTATLKLEQEGRGTGVLSDLAALTSAPAAEGEMSILRSRTMVEATVAPPLEWKHHERAFTAAQADEFRMDGPMRLGLTTRVESDSHRPLNDLLRLFGGRAQPAQRLFASIEPLPASSVAAPARIRVAFPESEHGARVKLSVPTRRGLPDRDECEFDYQPGARLDYQGLSLRLEALGEYAGAQYTLEYRPLDATVDEYLGKVDVEETSRNSGVIRLTVSDSDPERAAEFANALCHNYLLRSIRLGRSRATRTIEFVDEQLTEQKRLLEEAEAEVVALQQRNPAVILVSASAESLLKQLAEIDAERTRRALARVALGEAAELLDRGENDALSRLSRELPDLVSMSYIETIGRLGGEALALQRSDAGPTKSGLQSKVEELALEEHEAQGRLAALESALNALRDGDDAALGRLLAQVPGLSALDPITNQYLSELARVESEISGLSGALTPANPRCSELAAARGDLARKITLRLTSLCEGLQLAAADRVALRDSYRSTLDSWPGEERARIETALNELTQRVSRNLHARIESLASEERALEHEGASLEAKLAALPESEREVAEPLRRREAHAQVVKLLLDSQQQAQLSAAATLPSAILIDPAVPPASRHAPRLFFDFLLGCAAGLGLGVLASFVRQALSGAIHTQAEVEEATSLPVFGSIPDFRRGPMRIRTRRTGFLPLRDDPDGPISEAYRSVRESLRFANSSATRAGGGRLRTLACTSCAPGEGKSTTNVNLAMAFAGSEHRVLLVDADMRKPTVHSSFGVPMEPGLGEVLENRAAWRECVRPSGQTGLDLLCAGDPQGSPSELLRSGPMPRLIAEWRESYDLVLFDLPPALAVADAEILARELDAIVLVYRAGGVHREALSAMSRKLARAGARVAGALVNAARPSRSGASPYYGGYHYGYGKERGGKRRTKLERVG